MPFTVLGLQWGDEGKGKVVDMLAADRDMVVRFHGGNNAGHTLVIDGRKTVLHLVPSGILQPGVRCLVGPGVVVDPDVLIEELDALRSQGITDAEARLVVDARCHVITPYHKALDAAREARRGAACIGTTGRGIGPAYEDLASRGGIRLADLLDEARLTARLEMIMAEKALLLEDAGVTPPTPSMLVDWALARGARLRPLLGDTWRLLHAAGEAGSRLLLEGAQGTLLDPIHGTYPYVTSSLATTGAAAALLGLPPGSLYTVFGVFKAYTTRVGNGPFPTEIHGPLGRTIAERGHEVGSTTGRSRRVGWLDLPLLRMAMRTNGVTHPVMTKLDVLSGLDELYVCTAYRVDGEHREVASPVDLAGATIEPLLTRVDGWLDDLTSCRTYEALPPAARAFVDLVGEAIDSPVTIVSVGPGRDELIDRRARER